MRFLRYKALKSVMGPGRAGSGRAANTQIFSLEYKLYERSCVYERTRSARCARSLVTRLLACGTRILFHYHFFRPRFFVYNVFLKILTHFFRFLLWCLLQHKHYWGLELNREHWKFISIVCHHRLSLSLENRAVERSVSHFWPNRFRLYAALLRELCGTPELSLPSHTQ